MLFLFATQSIAAFVLLSKDLNFDFEQWKQHWPHCQHCHKQQVDNMQQQ
jgi:hypothetical protein